MVPAWLSPVANWQAPVSADIEPSNSLWRADSTALPVDVAPACATALREDFASGLPVRSKLLDWTVEESRLMTQLSKESDTLESDSPSVRG